jgi:hypothetical protein
MRWAASASTENMAMCWVARRMVTGMVITAPAIVYSGDDGSVTRQI